jgi:hypothetical protein
MRDDLQVFCPVHQSPMLHCDLTIAIDVSLRRERCYACEMPGCYYHYDVTLGYFLTSEGERKESDEKYRVLCPSHMTKMYIAASEPKKTTWKCGQLECNEICFTEDPLQASSAASG